MIISPQSLDTNLSQLLAEVKSGSMQLPEFQRDWTWDDNRIRGIIASLSQGYPMGAIMRLQYGNPDIQFKYRTITGVKGVSVKPEHLILDGQQRLTSIYQATSSKEPVSTKTEKGKAIKRYYYLSMEKCLDDDEDRFDAVLSIPEDRKIKENFDRDVKLDLSTREYEYENKLFPVNIVFDSNAVMFLFAGDCVCLSRLLVQIACIETNRCQEGSLINPIEQVCSQRVTETANCISTLHPVFSQVKVSCGISCGNKLKHRERNTASIDVLKHLAHCLSRRGLVQCNHRQLIPGNCIQHIRLETLELVHCFRLHSVVRHVAHEPVDVLGLPYESYIANRDAVLSGFKIAKEFLLRDQCVFRQRDLPYTTQLIPLAAICAVLGKSKCNEPNTIKSLSRWYWCGILGEMYGGANETRYAYDIEDMVEEVNGRPNAMHTINSAVFSSTRLLTLQTRLSAAYKGIMALLYKEKCRDFMNNTTIDIVNSMLESPDIHHIFPEAYCEKMGIKRERYNSIINKTPILPATNRSIGGNAPSEYLGAILKKVDGLTENELQARVESHFINYAELKADDFNGYFIDRAKSLLNLIEKAMNKPVTDRDAENTLDQFGASLA